jgi:glycosyltransferase involved in cell wall biosynthesis
MLDMVFDRASQFDVLHFHIDYLHFPLSARQETPHVTTLHGRLDYSELCPLYQQFRDMPLVSISDAQRLPLSWANWQATIYHGLPGDQGKFHEQSGEYLAFLGRISPEKRLDRAIEIARRAGKRLKIAAKIDPADKQYYRETIEPLMKQPCCEFIGEIGEHEKDDFLGNAAALLFPIDWPEPFGLVMIEAMARGTPVIAYPKGSVPEIIEDGVNGFIVGSLHEAVRAVEHIGRLSRSHCRESFNRRFSAERMASDYASVYESLLRPQVPRLEPMPLAS